jgi:hypothetical protein
VWIERKAAEIHAANPSWTMDRARPEEADVHHQAVVSSLVSGLLAWPRRRGVVRVRRVRRGVFLTAGVSSAR